MARALIMMAVMLSVASCGLFGGQRNAANRAESENELPFKAKLSKGEGRAYSVAVVHKGSSVADLRESVRFEATKYCLLTFGGSDAEWQMDPASQDWAFTQDGDRLIFRGECTAV